MVQVAGDVVIDGSIEIQDSQDIADGTFEFIRASSLTGGFTSEMFPSERWSWFVQDNSLFLRKGDSTPVRESTWGRIKAKRGDQPER